MVQRGRDFLLKAYIGDQYVTVAGVRSKTFTIGNEPIDITNSESGDWRQLKPGGYGLRSVAFSGAGVFTGDDTIAHMEDLVWGLRSGVFRIQFGNGDRIDGSFRVGSMTASGGVGDNQVYDFSMIGTGESTLTRV